MFSTKLMMHRQRHRCLLHPPVAGFFDLEGGFVGQHLALFSSTSNGKRHLPTRSAMTKNNRSHVRTCRTRSARTLSTNIRSNFTVGASSLSSSSPPRPIRTTTEKQQQQDEDPRTAILNSRLAIQEEGRISKKIQEYAAQEPTPISLLDLATTYSHHGDDGGCGDRSFDKQNGFYVNHHRGRMGQRLVSERTIVKVAQLVWRELPIRLAHRIDDLDHIILKDMPSVREVKSIYKQSFWELITIEEPSTPQKEKQFATLLQGLYQKHSNVLLLMAKGASEFRNQVLQQEHDLKRGGGTDHATLGKRLFAEQEECHHFLNKFYFSRVGIRVLAGQYLALRKQLLAANQYQYQQQFKFQNDGDQSNPNNMMMNNSSYIGMVNQHTSPYSVVRQAIENATRLCQVQYPGLDPPNVEVNGNLDLTFCYIPTHLHYIMLELIKNAMRATMEYHHFDTNGEIQPVVDKPPINVIIADAIDNEDVTIKVMDEGGGIPRSQIDYIWSYLYTTADPQVQERFLSSSQEQDNAKKKCSRHNKNSILSNHNQGPILAGLGYGLPMSRAYAQYFGGDLDLLSMEGYGTDAFCHLVRLGDKAASI